MYFQILPTEHRLLLASQYHITILTASHRMFSTKLQHLFLSVYTVYLHSFYLHYPKTAPFNLSCRLSLIPLTQSPIENRRPKIRTNNSPAVAVKKKIYSLRCHFIEFSRNTRAALPLTTKKIPRRVAKWNIGEIPDAPSVHCHTLLLLHTKQKKTLPTGKGSKSQ